MKKSLLLLMALFIMGGVNSWARVNVDMSTATASENATWNAETNTFSWTAQDAYIVIPGLSGDLTGCFLTFTKGDKDCHIDIVHNDNSVSAGGWNGNGRFSTNPGPKTQDLSKVSANLTDVKEVRISSGTASGSQQITAVSYFYPVIPKFNADGVATISLKSLVASDGLSFDPSTGVVTCNGNPGRLSLEFYNGVNLTSLKRYDVTISSGTDNNIMWRSVVQSQGTDVLAYYGSRWGGNLTTAERAKALAVNAFYWETSGEGTLAGISEDKRTFTISSITLTADKMFVADAHDVAIETLPHYIIDDKGTASLGNAIDARYGISTDKPLGDGGGEMNEYIDIEDYDELRIYTSDIMRVFCLNAANITASTSISAGNTLYLNAAPFSHNESEGYYYAKVSDIKNANNGQAKIIGVKQLYGGGSVNVSKIQVYKANPTYDYILSGQYSSNVDISSVTSDASATAIDCSGLAGNDVTITSANPNCIFKANSGVLANSKNVMVGTTIANLSLTDNYPFVVPESATATAASYSRNMTSQYGTICLPYAVSTPTNAKFYTLGAMDTETVTLVKVEGTLAAGTPVIVEKTSGTSISAAGSGALAVAGDATQGALQAYGSYVSTTVTPSDYSGYSIYALATVDDEQALWQTSNAINVKPFRAYFVSTTPSSAKLRFVSEEEGATAIEALTGEGNASVVGIFSVNGTRQNSLQKGINVVKLSDGRTQKIMVK